MSDSLGPALSLMFVLTLAGASAFGEDCNPKRPCDPKDCSINTPCDADADCSLKQDTRSCGHDVTLCVPFTRICTTQHFNDPLCEAAKAEKNAEFALEKANCEATKSLAKANCEATKTAAKAACEAQNVAAKADCERIKVQERLLCEVGLAGPFSCTASEVMSQLRGAKQDGLTDFALLSGFITTPFKNVSGQLAWRETACTASGEGVPYRNSQRSTDGFCTIDVQLISFVVDGQQMPAGDRFIRLELLPGGNGAAICGQRTVSTLDLVRFSGPVKIDKHPINERWLEVHVTDGFEVIDGGGILRMTGVPATESIAASGSALNGSSSPDYYGPKARTPTSGYSYVVVAGDCLATIAERAYARQLWETIYDANRASIKDPDLIYPGQRLRVP